MAKLSPIQEDALLLRNGNPPAFERFVGRLDQIKDKCVEAFTASSPNEILIFQGRVQAYTDVLRILKECTLEREKKPLPPLPQAPTGA